MLNVISFSKLRGQGALFTDVLAVFTATLDAEGQSLWVHQFHKKTTDPSSAPTFNPSLSASELKSFSLEFLQQFLQQSHVGKLSFLVRKWIHGSALLGSGTFGVLLPPNDIVFFSKSQQKDTLTLAHASTFSSELVLEWLVAVVDRSKIRAEKSESAPNKDHIVQFFSELSSILTHFNIGLKKGSSFRKSGSKKFRNFIGKPLTEIRIPMDSRAYQMLDQFFSNLNNYRQK